MKRLCLAALTVFALSSPPAYAKDNLCTVASIQGAGASVWREGQALLLQDAMTLANDDRIETRAETIVTLRCSDEMQITIGPDTAIDLGKINGQDQSWSAFLLDGIARFARPVFGGERFEVRTPSAVASVRSTVWVVEVARDRTAVFVDEGGVSVAARDGGGLLGPGEGIDVEADGTAGTVKRWGVGRVRVTKQRLGLLGE